MKALITGGSGFIGTNLAARIQASGGIPVVFDNLSRKGACENLEWLKNNGKLIFINGDVRDVDAVDNVFKKYSDIEAIFHLAAQVAVTTSITNPRDDFENNAIGTFNVLEGTRKHTPDVPFIYSSTNKVYGGLEDLKVSHNSTRYYFENLPLGISETRNLDFHSPYGCSKGAADQYVRDYHRIYGLRTVCFRQSCIYGPHQMGVEDQGWVAWFLIATMTGKDITIYGDGKQVRDILFCDDLVDLYLNAVASIEKVEGNAYNIGGGSNNTLSLLEFISKMKDMGCNPKNLSFSDWRAGDQPIFIADISKIHKELGWYPKTGMDEGLRLIKKWISESLPTLRKI